MQGVTCTGKTIREYWRPSLNVIGGIWLLTLLLVKDPSTWSLKKIQDSLTLFIPSSSEWVASPSPSNIGAKRSKVGVGQEKPDKNAHISIANIAASPSVSDTTSLFSSPIYSGSSIHLSSESSTLCSLSSCMKVVYSMLQKTNISLTSHHIFSILNVKLMP